VASFVDIVEEMRLAGIGAGVPYDLDGVRRAKIRQVEAVTGRPLIVYASDMTYPSKMGSDQLLGLINWDDRDSFAEALQGVTGDTLDVLLQSPGGLAVATEAIVKVLRSRFADVRFIVPFMAKSAATMLALSGNQILMGVPAELGPIDPQMPTGRGGYAPADAILEQFRLAKRELASDPTAIPAWLPILQQYGPSLLVECQNQLDLSEQLVSTWLANYMFSGERDAGDHAAEVAKKLNEHDRWKSHGRRVDIDWLKGPEARIKVMDLASDPILEDAVMQLHLAIRATFFISPAAFKLVENGQGNGIIGNARVFNVQLAPAPSPQPDQLPAAPAPGSGGALPPPQPTPSGQKGMPQNRQQRRSRKR